MNTVYNLAFVLLIPFLFVFDEPLESTRTSDLPECQQTQKSYKAKTANIVFKSTDGGQSWQDISEGLPENLQKDSIGGNSFFVK